MTQVGGVVGEVRIIRSIIQQVDDPDPDEPPVHWLISCASAEADGEVRPVLFADLFVTDDTGWQVGASAIAVLSGVPAPEHGDLYSPDERHEIEEEWIPQLEHVLWDVAAAQARAQCAVVAAPIEVPRKTPERTMATDDVLQSS